MENIIDAIIDRERNFDTEALAILEHNFVYENSQYLTNSRIL